MAAGRPRGHLADDFRRYDLGNRPLDLRQTLRLAGMWAAPTWVRVDRTGAWYAARTEAGPGTVCIQHKGDHLLAGAWGPGTELLLDGVPELVGLNDAGLDEVVAAHPFVRQTLKRFRGYRQSRTGEVFSHLVGTALAQKVTGKASSASLRALARKWGERSPGPRQDLWLLPRPEDLAERPYYAFHELNVEQHRADLVRRIARRSRALQRAATLPPTEARAHLEKLRGIGPWTSGVVMSGALGDPDAVPTADYHLANFVAWAFVGQARASDQEMLSLLEPYAGRRAQVARMVKGSGTKAPRFGPKREARDIRGM